MTRARVITAIDHVQLSMPAGGEDAARTFYDDASGAGFSLQPSSDGNPL